MDQIYGAVVTWTKLMTAEVEYYSIRPPYIEDEDFERSMAIGLERAGQLADQFKQYQEKYPHGPMGVTCCVINIA